MHIGFLFRIDSDFRQIDRYRRTVGRQRLEHLGELAPAVQGMITGRKHFDERLHRHATRFLRRMREHGQQGRAEYGQPEHRIAPQRIEQPRIVAQHAQRERQIGHDDVVVIDHAVMSRSARRNLHRLVIDQVHRSIGSDQHIARTDRAMHDPVVDNPDRHPAEIIQQPVHRLPVAALGRPVQKLVHRNHLRRISHQNDVDIITVSRIVEYEHLIVQINVIDQKGRIDSLEIFGDLLQGSLVRLLAMQKTFQDIPVPVPIHPEADGPILIQKYRVSLAVRFHTDSVQHFETSRRIANRLYQIMYRQTHISLKIIDSH